MPRRVLLLAATTAYQTDDLAAAAARLGVETVLGTDRCHVLAETWTEGALALDFRHPERAVDQVVEAAAARPFDGVVATDERTALIASLVAARLGLRHASPEAARVTLDKRRFREMAHAAGLPHPRFEVATSPAAAAAAAERVGYPVVLKPLYLSGSRGVMRADAPAELEARAARLARLLADPAVAAAAPEPETAGHMLVEAFVPGPEIAIEGLLEGGALSALAVFDKPDPLDGPFFAETIYVTPSGLPEGRVRAAIDAVAGAARAVGLDEGPVHAELRLGGDAPIVIELAARSIGGLCGRVLRLGAGISLEEVVIAHAVGLGAREQSGDGEPAGGVMMMPVEQGGVLADVTGVDAARAVAGVRDVVITARVGEVLVPLPEGHTYAGFIFAGGARAHDVVAALRAAREKILLHVRATL